MKVSRIFRSRSSSVDRNATENIAPRLLIWNDGGILQLKRVVTMDMIET